MHDDEHIEDRLLDVLRRRTGISELRYARPPTRLTGGFWAEILSVRLDGAPPELDRELVARLMPDGTTAQREIAVQTEVAAQGFPTPSVRLAGGADEGLGWAYMVMDRAEGRILLTGMAGRDLLRAIPRFVSMPDIMARLSARLHALDPEPVRQALRQSAPDAVVDMDAYLDRLEARARARDRDDLAAALGRLRDSRPPRCREVVCHGDLHPLNILLDDGRATLLDWSNALIADPVYDLAFSALVVALTPNVPRPVRPLLNVGERGYARWFLRRYNHHAGPTASRDGGVLRWHTGLHCLRALVDAAEHGNPGHPFVRAAPALQARLDVVIAQL
jgi:aminoglycoside phosphotransferase